MATEPSVADITSDEFLKNFADSGLSGIDEAQAAAAELAPATGSRIASRMVANGTLSVYQANALIRGHASELRMGNYEIMDKLGVGGMGAVYKARHRRMKRVVALKVLNQSVAKSSLFAQRFQREVETIAKLQHPNIVMAFDADEAEEGPFLIMEFVDGCDLTGEVSAGGPLAVADAVDCILQAARGLECAHKQGIIHRDIKPSNLMRDRSGAVKVTDLGLARLNSPDSQSPDQFSITQAGSVLGTVDYMAPEQALDSTTVDARADIYSLGATLHYLLTGHPPFQGNTLMAVLVKHRDAPTPSLRNSRADVPARLDEIYQRMMAKKAEDRFDAMASVIMAIEALKQSELLSEQKPQAGKAEAGINARNDQTVLLQTSPSADTDATIVKEPAPAAQSLVVVLVEPSRTQAGIIRKLLAQLEITTVHVCESGRQALDIARSTQANAILSAMHLKDMTGVQLALALLAEPGCTGTGFVLATSEADTEELAALPTNPRVAKLVKPFDLEKLSNALKSVTLRPDQVVKHSQYRL